MLLGIDPGLATTGFAVLNCAQRKLKLLDCGIITTSPHESLAARLKELDNSLHEIIISYSIKHAAVEKLYFNKNIKTCLLVAHCRGVILNQLAMANINIYEYTPREIKKAVSGNGNAPKQTVQLMIGKILNLSKIIEPDDAADSVAAAVCLSNELEKAKCMNI